MASESIPRFSIITPSFRSGEWLKLCIASVADQQGPTFEHIVQDSVSDDGTLEWLPQDQRVQAFIEKDKGMYDAVNRGFKRARGEILAYLNCDEQYLPGALAAVDKYFNENPGIDVAFADAVVVKSDGEYICHRYALRPVLAYTWLRFSVLTCSMFLRRKVIDEQRLFFDTQWRDLGDIYWVEEVLKRGIPNGILRHMTSVFTDTGENMNLSANATREKAILKDNAPAWTRVFKQACVMHHRLRMLASGVFSQKPFEYSLYTRANPEVRTVHQVEKPDAIWHGRASP